ncbi:MAG: glycosyltransferase family 9 protein [Candidatus Micrarchaeota archaeon]
MKSTRLRAYFWMMLTSMKKAALFAILLPLNFLIRMEKAPDLRAVKKILIIHGEHSSIGDAVLFSALLAPIRRKFPKAKIDLLIRHPAQEVLKYNENVDAIIPYTEEEGANLLTQEFAPLKIAGMLRGKNYDMVINSEHALRFIILSYLTGARIRVGLDLAGRGFFLTRKVAYPPYKNRTKLELEYYLDLARAIGIEQKANAPDMRISYSSKEKKFAAKFLKENRIGKNAPIIAIHAGGGIWKKRWPLYKFAKLCDALISGYGAKIIALGGKDDAKLYGQMEKMMKGKICIAAGRTSILETAALIDKCNLAICNDSAISHIASAAGIRVIALFGVDSPIRWGPFGNIAIMKHKRLPACNLLCNYDYLYALDECFDEKNPYCMDLISVEDVMKEVRGKINK